jgi:hypothetical protein
MLTERRKCLELIREHQDANQNYLDEGIRLLELAQKAGALFRKQAPAEKRRLLGFVLSNCTWKEVSSRPHTANPLTCL